MLQIWLKCVLDWIYLYGFQLLEIRNSTKKYRGRR
jgi:hypothetical protein